MPYFGRMSLRSLFLALLVACLAMPARAAGTETIDEALCRLIDAAAQDRNLPVDFFTRLIWRESAFRTTAVSPRGALGVAQFMPRTAAERGLSDPFDPEQAIPTAAHLLADLRITFGNLGLAAAAYNGGPGRVQTFLASGKGLPDETRRYVQAITGRSAEDWAAAGEGKDALTPQSLSITCLEVTAGLLRARASDLQLAGLGADIAPLAPWGIQLAGNFSKVLALRSFARASRAYSRVLGDVRPMIIGTLLRSRGSRPFYRVRVPAASRQDADLVCNQIRGAGGSCLVLRS